VFKDLGLGEIAYLRIGVRSPLHDCGIGDEFVGIMLVGLVREMVITVDGRKGV